MNRSPREDSRGDALGTNIMRTKPGGRSPNKSPQRRRSRRVASGPRERVLKAASRLFYRRGIHQVGIDAIIGEARVAKASFYDHFKSKDDLIAAYVHERDREFAAWFDEKMRNAPADARERLLFVFTVLKAFVEPPNFHGCAFIGAIEELDEPGHPGRRAAVGHKARLRTELAELARSCGATSPDAIAESLALLIDGALVASRAGLGTDPVAAAARSAAILIDHAISAQ